MTPRRQPRMARSTLLQGAVAAAAAVAIAWPAEAHILDAYHAGWGHGFGHPFSGLDHILAMGAVGVWAAQMGGRALWALPLSFPVVMAAAALAGAAGIELPLVETGIAGSVVAMGLLVALAARPSARVGALVVAVFAFFHGHAHGSELPEAGNALLYGLGFVVATALLHAIGIGFGLMLRRRSGRSLARVGGCAVAAAGVLLLAGSI